MSSGIAAAPASAQTQNQLIESAVFPHLESLYGKLVAERREMTIDGQPVFTSRRSHPIGRAIRICARLDSALETYRSSQPLDITGILFEFAAFSEGAAVDGTRIRFERGGVYELNVARLDSARRARLMTGAGTKLRTGR